MWPPVFLSSLLSHLKSDQGEYSFGHNTRVMRVGWGQVATLGCLCTRPVQARGAEGVVWGTGETSHMVLSCGAASIKLIVRIMLGYVGRRLMDGWRKNDNEVLGIKRLRSDGWLPLDCCYGLFHLAIGVSFALLSLMCLFSHGHRCALCLSRTWIAVLCFLWPLMRCVLHDQCYALFHLVTDAFCTTLSLLRLICHVAFMLPCAWTSWAAAVARGYVWACRILASLGRPLQKKQQTTTYLTGQLRASQHSCKLKILLLIILPKPVGAMEASLLLCKSEYMYAWCALVFWVLGILMGCWAALSLANLREGMKKKPRNKVKFMRLCSEAVVPKRGSNMAAGLDLSAIESVSLLP